MQNKNPYDIKFRNQILSDHVIIRLAEDLECDGFVLALVYIKKLNFNANDEI